MNTLRKLIAALLLISVCLSFGSAAAFADGETEAPAAETSEDADVSGEEAQPVGTEPPEPEEEAAEDDGASVQGDEAPVTENGDEPSPDEAEAEEPDGESPEEETSGEAEAEEEDAEEEAAARVWVEPGNTSVEILGGGYYLTVGESLYYFDGGLYLDGALLNSDDGRNLNLSGSYVYYTVSGDVRRIPLGGGTAETVYSFPSCIKQLYVMGGELRFISGGAAYSYDMQTEKLEILDSPDSVQGLIPTPYGNLYLTGSALDYTLWAETSCLESGIEQCYADGEWLVLLCGEERTQVSLAGLFDGQFAPQAYSLHQDELVGNGLSDEEQLANEAAFLQSDTYAQMQEAITEVQEDAGIAMFSGALRGTFSVSASYASTAVSDLSTNQTNIVKRARQMAEVLWTPLKTRYSWGGDDSSYVNNNKSSGSKVVATDGTVTYGYFQAGKTYQGVPYSQAVSTGYVGWSISIDNFVAAVNNSSSKFYSGYSYYSRTAPYYGSDCSGFVSWAWDLPYRCTCTSLLNYSTYVGKSISQLKVGYCINNPNSHVMLVTDVGYNSSGEIVCVEITEQTPAKMRVTCYCKDGNKSYAIAGKSYSNYSSLSTLQSYYLNSGYSIYSRNYSGSVKFTESSVVPLSDTGYAAAPKIAVAVNASGTAMTVTLTHSSSGALIYYTTDGSDPASSSTRIAYSGAFEIASTTEIRAIADCGDSYKGSNELTYTVTVTKADAPRAVLVDGDMQDEYVSSGSKITLMNENGDKVYYTTDGSTPTTGSSAASATGITVTGSMTLKAIAVSSESLNSDVVTINLKVGTFYAVTATYSGGGYITPGGETGVLKGSSATFSIVPLENYKVSDVKVDGKSVGAVTSYTLSNVTGKHTITATFEVDLPFTDVKSHWAASSIAFTYSKNLFAGTTATAFSPEAYMTRGMFITVLGRFAGNGQWTDLESWSGTLGITNGSVINIRQYTTTADGYSAILGRTGATGTRLRVTSTVLTNESVDGTMWYGVTYNGVSGYIRAVDTTTSKTLLYVYSGGFTDLPSGRYYTGYAQWANIYSIMNGTTNTTFSPNNYIKRQDICVLMYNYLKNYVGKTVSTSVSSRFLDDSSISSYAKDAVYAMKNIGVVNGYQNGNFVPQGYATRAEVAKMFESLYAYLYG